MDKPVFEEILIKITQKERKALQQFASEIGCDVSCTVRGYIALCAPIVSVQGNLSKLIAHIKLLQVGYNETTKCIFE